MGVGFRAEEEWLPPAAISSNLKPNVGNVIGFYKAQCMCFCFALSSRASRPRKTQMFLRPASDADVAQDDEEGLAVQGYRLAGGTPI